MAAASKRGKKAQATRATLMDAALELMSRKGFTAATIDEIAKEAGVSKGLAYYHFKNKIELAEEILDQGVRALIESFDAAVEGSAQDDAFAALLVAFCDACAEDCRFARFYLSAVWCEDGLRSQRVSEIESQLVESIAQRIATCNGTDAQAAEFSAVEVIGLVFTAAARYFGSSAKGATIDKTAFTRNVVGFAIAALSLDAQMLEDTLKASAMSNEKPAEIEATNAEDTAGIEPVEDGEAESPAAADARDAAEPQVTADARDAAEPQVTADAFAEVERQDSDDEGVEEAEEAHEDEQHRFSDIPVASEVLAVIDDEAVGEPEPEPEPEPQPEPEPEPAPKPKARKKKAPQVDPGQESLFSFL